MIAIITNHHYQPTTLDIRHVHTAAKFQGSHRFHPIDSTGDGHEEGPQRHGSKRTAAARRCSHYKVGESLNGYDSMALRWFIRVNHGWISISNSTVNHSESWLLIMVDHSWSGQSTTAQQPTTMKGCPNFKHQGRPQPWLVCRDSTDKLSNHHATG